MDGCLSGFLCRCDGTLVATCDGWAEKPWAYFVRVNGINWNGQETRCDPGTPPDPPCTIREFPIPTPDSAPDGIASGTGGDLWFAETRGNKIGRISPAGTITEYPVPTKDSGPMGVFVDPDGTVWFTESRAGKIGRLTASGEVAEFPIGDESSAPTQIRYGLFTKFGSGAIGQITVMGGAHAFAELRLSAPNSGPFGIDIESSGAWFTESRANRIGVLELPATLGQLSEYDVPTPDSDPRGIAAADDRKHVWFAEYRANKIGRIALGGEITEFPMPTADSAPLGMVNVVGAGLFVTELRGNKIARVSVSGGVTEFPLANADSGPSGIALGRDGNLWFTESTGNRIGRMMRCPEPPPPPTDGPAPSGCQADPCRSYPGYTCQVFDAGAPAVGTRCCNLDSGVCR
jgi:virginiamycin B lyase